MLLVPYDMEWVFAYILGNLQILGPDYQSYVSRFSNKKQICQNWITRVEVNGVAVDTT